MSASAAVVKVPKHIQGRTIIEKLPKKLAQRAIYNQNHRLRQRKKDDDGERISEKTAYIRNQARQHSLIREHVRNQRAWRKEDWIKGPLAPKRDVGDQAETFGAISPMELYQMTKPKALLKKEHGIVVGDRVCVVKPGHKLAGRIGRVKEVRADSEDVILDGLNQTYVAMPDYMLIKEPDKSKIRTIEKPFSLHDVRLVAPLPDPETGKLRDHVIQELSFAKLTREEKKGLEPPTRYITNLDPPQYIPYPPKAEAEAEEFQSDTLRIEVDQKTWIPTIHMPPMPRVVLDELRNKFSRLRIRHDRDYIEKIEKVDRKALRKARTINMMMTPLKQARRVERKERQALGRPELDDASLAKIGEYMERRLQGTAVDVSIIPASTAPAPPPS